MNQDNESKRQRDEGKKHSIHGNNRASFYLQFRNESRLRETAKGGVHCMGVCIKGRQGLNMEIGFIREEWEVEYTVYANGHACFVTCWMD